MSTTAAAAESAAPVANAPVTSDVDGGIDTSAVGPAGTLDDLYDGLGYSDEQRAESIAERERDGKGRFVAKDDEPKEKPDVKAKGKDEPAPAPDDDAEIKAIMRRSRERRLARQKVTPAPVVQQAAPAAQQPAPQAAPAPKPTEPKVVATEQAVRDVIDLLGRLADGDEKTATGAAPDAERSLAVAEIKAKIDAIGESTKETAAVKSEMQQLREQLRGIESVRKVREHLETQFDTIADATPLLAGKRNATDLLYQGASLFFEKYRKFPDVKALAEHIEKRLKASAPAEKTRNEKQQSPSRKTVSNSLGSPPAERLGPDARSAADALRDFNSRFGLE